MWSGMGSALIGAAGSIAGGLLGGSSGGDNDWQFYENERIQKEFAQNSIRWKVADAKAAGLHPLAVLGSMPTSYSPVTVGDTPQSQDMSWLSSAGQNIGRAIDAKMTASERAQNAAYTTEVQALNLEHMKLQNESLKLDMVQQLARDAQRAVNTQQQVPPMPSFRSNVDGSISPDTTPTKLFELKPPEIAVNDPLNSHGEAGSHPDVRYVRTSDGGYAPVRSQVNEEALEDDILGMLAWNTRNRLGPTVMDLTSGAPSRSFLPDGGKSDEWTWTFNVAKQAYYPVRRSDWLKRIDRRFNPF